MTVLRFPVNDVSGVKQAVRIGLGGDSGGDGDVSVILPHPPGLVEATVRLPASLRGTNEAVARGVGHSKPLSTELILNSDPK